jgi:hypothetical protein
MAKKPQGPLDTMIIKIREVLSRLNLHTGLLIALLIILLIFLILFIAYWIYVSKWYGVTDVACSDCKTCTTDFRFPDGTCGSRAVQNGTSCAGEDVCYNSSAMPVCLCGLCVGSDSRFCKGYCDVDGSECPDLPISPRLTFEPDVECIAHSCVYTIVGGVTSDCESWLGENRTLPIVTQGCLFTRFTDVGFDFPPGICFYRYNCAPFDFIDSFSLSHGNNKNKNHKDINSKQQQHHHQSIKSTNKNGTIHKSDITDLNAALVYLHINNLKFPDLPTKDTQIISLTNTFANLIDSKVNAYNTQTLSRISKSDNNPNPNTRNKNNKDSETTPDETDEDDDEEQQQQQNDEKKLSDYVNKHKQKN